MAFTPFQCARLLDGDCQRTDLTLQYGSTMHLHNEILQCCTMHCSPMMSIYLVVWYADKSRCPSGKMRSTSFPVPAVCRSSHCGVHTALFWILKSKTESKTLSSLSGRTFAVKIWLEIAFRSLRLTLAGGLLKRPRPAKFCFLKNFEREDFFCLELCWAV